MQSHDLVEKWQPSAAQTEELAKLRHAMMQQLFRTIDTGRVPDSDVGESADPVPPRSARAIPRRSKATTRRIFL